MLFSLSGDRIDSIPKKRQAEWNQWTNALAQADYDAARDGINKYIDDVLSKGQAVFVSSYIPGSNWTNTPYQPLYLACNQSDQQSSYFFGLLVWQTVIDRQDEWYFQKAAEEDEILGTTYFRKTD